MPSTSFAELQLSYSAPYFSFFLCLFCLKRHHCATL
jgi:hypothetical protein